MLRTHNRGSDWEQVGSLAPLCGDAAFTGVGDLDFADVQHGWASMDCAGQQLPRLARTEDGGATWQRVTARGAGPTAIIHLAFVNARVGYAVNGAGHLLVSRDAGASFTLVSADKQRGPISFISEQNGWQLRDGQLFATGDAGATWQHVPLGHTIVSLDVTREGYLWVITSEPAKYGTVNRLLHAPDQGQHWTEQRIQPSYIFPHLASYWQGTVHFTDAQHGWMVRNYDTVPTGLYSTDDGGASWVQLVNLDSKP